MEDKKELVEVAEARLPMLAEDKFEQTLAFCEKMVKTGFLPEAIKTGAQAAALVVTGKELGIGAMQALRSINIIKGKPTLPPQLMLALAYKRIPGFVGQKQELTTEKAVWTFFRPGMTKPHVETFTIKDAEAQGLTDKYNWKTMRKIMLNWRCIAAGLRLVAPDVVLGLYTPEEMDPNVKVLNGETGEIEIPVAEEVVVKDPPKPTKKKEAEQPDMFAGEPIPPPEEKPEVAEGGSDSGDIAAKIAEGYELIAQKKGGNVADQMLFDASKFDGDKGPVGFKNLDGVIKYANSKKAEDKKKKWLGSTLGKLRETWNEIK